MDLIVVHSQVNIFLLWCLYSYLKKAIEKKKKIQLNFRDRDFYPKNPLPLIFEEIQLFNSEALISMIFILKGFCLLYFKSDKAQNKISKVFIFQFTTQV